MTGQVTGDAWRLAFGTLTAVRVPPPRTLDRRTTGGAMLLAPVVGLLLGVAAAAVVAAVRFGAGPSGGATNGPSAVASAGTDLLAAALGIAVLALLTRGLHLDGAADTADGLGSGKPAPDALAIMRRSDVGPFGVATVVLLLVIQIAALTAAITGGQGTEALITAVLTSRLALTWACTTGVVAARTDGLGNPVIGSVRRSAAAAATVLVLAAVVGLALLDDDASARTVAFAVAGVVVGLVAAQLFRQHCARRFGGITGDVLGAVIEVTTTVVLVVIAFS